MSTLYRTHTCGELTEGSIGETVRIAGWIDRIRDHGGVAFVDLRDQYGKTQVVVHDLDELNGLHRETVITVQGKLVPRDDDNINENLITGKVEVASETIEVLGKSKATLPFSPDSSRNTREDIRLKYRFLDLRNEEMKDNILFRSKVISYLRRTMENMGFCDIATPILTSSSPEGARDYIIPSRKHEGKFYALPQAPQIFKQLLMVSGFDKYFQIAPCFRDEDARADRSPGEFYQLDFEMAFATQEDVFKVGETVLYETFKEFAPKGMNISKPPFRRIPYKEAMLKYGTDKPDLRNPLEITDLTDFFAGVDFKPFQGKPVRGIAVAGAAKQSRSWYKKMLDFATSIGMGGLGYITVESGAFKGPIEKFLSDEQKSDLTNLLNLKEDDTLFFICDSPGKVNYLAGGILAEVAKRMELIDESSFEFCYVMDFPMYEKDDDGKIIFTHNPFSMPQGELEALETKDPLEILAYQYDIVCNGVELSSGAVRNHKPEVMVKAFEIAGYTREELEKRFGALFHAFEFGAPPHAGMAPGVDRMLMLLRGEESIREVIAFPMNANAQDLMLEAPNYVDEVQLRDVHVRLRRPLHEIKKDHAKRENKKVQEDEE